jgi:hypothetical protein
MPMNRFELVVAAVASIALGCATQAQASTVGFTANPTTNAADFNAFVLANGGTVNTNVDLETHPLGVLQSNWYLVSDGVTLTALGDDDQVAFGAGPSQGNWFSSPVSPGEGPHPASNFLFDGAAVSNLTISFATPVLGAGLFVIDYYNPANNNALTINAFGGPNGSGALLGTFSSRAFNFQINNMYFMGIGRAEADIRSVVFASSRAVAGDITGIDNIQFGQSGLGGQTVPEPASLTLLGLGVAGLAHRFRRQLVRFARPARP